ncbi:MAG TPA: hypothetical protein VFQ76_14935 [Longimicrobiaceae bacterium]|nr:hypothetical protein [Longimicrobiaceae bacterium]
MSIKRVLLATALGAVGVMAALPLNSARAAGGCDGRYSWLVPSACTYCEWGGSCGGCQISGCTVKTPT